MRTWRDAGMPLSNIAVNVSAVGLREKGFVDHVLEVLDEAGLDPLLLERELTETVLMMMWASIMPRSRDPTGSAWRSVSAARRIARASASAS